MDAALKELEKLEKLTALGPSSAKGKSPAIHESLDSLLASLRNVHSALEQNTATQPTHETLVELSQTVEAKKKEVDERQKEIYSSMSRLGKTLDKKFSTPLPSYNPLFASKDAITAMERTIALHFLRTGQFETAEIFIKESNADIPPGIRNQFVDLHRILESLRKEDISDALEWVSHNHEFLQQRLSPLEFNLHRFQYVRLLLSSPTPNAAIAYSVKYLRPLYKTRAADFQRLMAALVYLPADRLLNSPYADLASPTLHSDLISLFAKEYCASLGMSKQVQLRVVGDIGGGSALAKIEKGRQVMKEMKTEWNQTGELPSEIPLPPENRYHSIFACPVSKEQSTDQNPPMMMSCGHVVSKDSLQKLSKPGGRVKCPYCPSEALASQALRVYF